VIIITISGLNEELYTWDLLMWRQEGYWYWCIQLQWERYVASARNSYPWKTKRLAWWVFILKSLVTWMNTHLTVNVSGLNSMWKLWVNRRLNTSADVSKFKMLPFHNHYYMLISAKAGAWGGALTLVCSWQYSPWTGSIKPSLQHLQFCQVGLSLGILIFPILFIILPF
jgi:hypothetical protein